MGVPLQTSADVLNDYATLSFVVRQMLSRIATSTLVRVVACTNSGGISPWGTVDVQPLMNQIAGDDSSWPHQTLYRLPYCRLQGGANAVILDPEPGDIGLACFASRDISPLKQQAAIDAVKGGNPGVNPGSARQCNMADGLYVGGVLNGVPAQYVAFSSGGITVLSPTAVTIQAPTINLKGDVVQTDGDVTASGSITAIGDVVGNGVSLHDHTHSGVQTGGGNTGPPNP